MRTNVPSETPARTFFDKSETERGASPGYDKLTELACNRSAQSYWEPVENGELISDVMTDAQVVISSSDDFGCVTLAFRGSSSRADWLANLWFPLRSLPSPHRSDVKAHSGFLRQYMSLHAHILRKLDDMHAKHVLLTGHSLGGALATIAAAMLPEKYTYDLVTFGGPRPGNEQLGDAAYHKCRSCMRIVHDRDIVPLVPLQAMGYHHVCEPWVLLADCGSVTPVAREMSMWNQLCIRTCGLLRKDCGIGDHSMQNYTKGLRNKPKSESVELTSMPARAIERSRSVPITPGADRVITCGSP